MRGDQFSPIRPGKFGPGRGEQNQIIRAVNALQGSAGFGFQSGPFGLVGLPPDPDEVWAVTKADTGSGGGPDQGSGQGVQGALHAWRQIRFFAGIHATWEEDPAGIFGTVDYNPLVELNGISIPAGTVVRAYRGPATQCWVCTWSGTEGSGGATRYHFDCDTGLITRV